MVSGKLMSKVKEELGAIIRDDKRPHVWFWLPLLIFLVAALVMMMPPAQQQPVCPNPHFPHYAAVPMVRVPLLDGVGARHKDTIDFDDSASSLVLLQLGYRLCKVNVWTTYWELQGIQIVYCRRRGSTVDEEVVLGAHRGYDHPKSYAYTLELEEGEELLRMSGIADDRVHGLVLTTSTGRQLELGSVSKRTPGNRFDFYDFHRPAGDAWDRPMTIAAFYGGVGGNLHNIGAIFTTTAFLDEALRAAEGRGGRNTSVPDVGGE